MALRELPRERFTFSQLMLPFSTLDDDGDACGAAGFGMSVSEAKLGVLS
jgi:hypothetical protein